jgi:hypothetical protein
MEQAAIDIMKPVFESSVYLAARYCKACGRDTVTAEDMQYGMKYAARNVLGKYTESFFPEVYDDEDDSDEEDSEEDEGPEEPFTRYEGTEPDFLEMNECYDTWDSWVPESPAEILLKNAIDARIQEKEDDF